MTEPSIHSNSPPVPVGRFAPTRWTLVLRARGDSDEARAALSELCEAYYAPVKAFIGRIEPDPERAQDLTQSFFAGLLARRKVDAVEPGRARFRSYLLGAVKHFLAEDSRRARAAKRGSGLAPVSLETMSSSARTANLPLPGAQSKVPDAFFDRQWAVTVVDRAVGVLAAESAKAGKRVQFEALKPWLLGEVTSLSQADVAQQLGLSEGAVKVAVHRLRKQIRELVRTEIAQTIPESSQIQEELHYLVEALAQSDLHGQSTK